MESCDEYKKQYDSFDFPGIKQFSYSAKNNKRFTPLNINKGNLTDMVVKHSVFFVFFCTLIPLPREIIIRQEWITKCQEVEVTEISHLLQ